MKPRMKIVIGVVIVFFIFVIVTAGELYQMKIKTVSPKIPQPVVVESTPIVVEDPGALIRVSMVSTVGVLLDDIPSAEREKFVNRLQEKPTTYWKDLATRQIRFTTLRRNYGSYYGKKPLPLPPEELWRVNITGSPKRELVDKHDFVTVTYDFDSTILTDTKSPADTEPVFASVGGIYEDTLLLPMDPQFVFQRTRFACMNESESPPNSIDAEEADFYFDQKCHVEKELSKIGCHQTELPTESCTEAVTAHIGAAKPVMRFERIPWNADLADSVRIGKITNPDGPDLMPLQERFQEHRITYRYIPENSCTLIEKCTGAPGWRQLLMFPTGDVNVGAKPLIIGEVDYFQKKKDPTVLADHGVYEYSACHQHYHFSHYGSFTLGTESDALNRKQAFCLQPTSRPWNNEASPLNHPFGQCIDQGVAVGWLDEYQMGLECQWLDVTDVTKNKDTRISFTSNPDAMMCEGTLKYDARGKQLFEKTKFTQADGKPVDRPVCDLYKDWDKNNTIAYTLHMPDVGESYITEPCGHDEFGPLRNCGLRQQRQMYICEPGKQVKVSCMTTSPKTPKQIVRFCEGSHALDSGIPCTYNDALATLTVPTGDILLNCPAARDQKIETGGLFAAFTGALFPEEGTSPVKCTVTSVEPVTTL